MPTVATCTARKYARVLFCLLALGMASSCGPGETKPDSTRDQKSVQEKDTKAMQARARTFLDAYQADYARLWKEWTTTAWQGATTGAKEAFDAHARADLALKKLHSDRARYEELQALRKHADTLPPLDRRALAVADLKFKENQLPEDLLEKMATLSARINQAFSTFRGEMDGKRCSNNQLLDVLGHETDSGRRQAAWEALKQVGAAVGPDLIALARLRNEGARKLGFRDFWDMKIRTQEHDPDQLLATFDELEKLTREPFRKMKDTLDQEHAADFGIEPTAMMPWHYDNPFFQAPPPSGAVDLDIFYKEGTKEDIVAHAKSFFQDIGLPIEAIVARSDLFEREGKDQHAFCEDMDREGDVRTLLNIRPTAEWMDTMLHENGHAVYDVHLDRDLPYNLRSANHAFTTEGVAMMLGALAKTPSWIVAYAGADQEQVDEAAEAILAQRRREQLIFCRWCLVMLHFEKALYENPDRPDLNAHWWALKKRFQLLTPPPDRNTPDWAAKPHFTIAPVYYHNYQLGELFAAQLRHKLAELAGHKGPTSSLSFNGKKEFGVYLKKNVFLPGKRDPWPAFVEKATGEPLTAKYFAAELSDG
jgi:peptidyl-dipeptidase A